jgi:hypothetical protein
VSIFSGGCKYAYIPGHGRVYPGTVLRLLFASLLNIRYRVTAHNFTHALWVIVDY